MEIVDDIKLAIAEAKIDVAQAWDDYVEKQDATDDAEIKWSRRKFILENLEKQLLTACGHNDKQPKLL